MAPAEARRARPGAARNMAAAMDTFLQETTMHGWRYLAGDSRRNVVEVLFWLIVNVSVFATAGYLLKRLKKCHFERKKATKLASQIY